MPDRQFRALLESAPDGIVLVDAAGCIAEVNRQAEGLFGYARAELLGEKVELLVPHRFRESHLGHRDGYARDPGTRPMGLELELSGLRKDGTEFPVEISLSPMETEGQTLVITFIRDVTERKRAEAERLVLAQEQAAHAESEAAAGRLAEILAGIDAVVWEAESPERERFTFVSRHAETFLGLPVSRWTEEQGLWADVVHPDDRELVRMFFREAADRGDDHELEYRLRTADGRTVWVRDIVRVIPAGERSGGGLRGVMVDVTERRELEARLLQAQKMEAVGQLAGGIAHDFNNLLTVISGYTNLLTARTTDERSLFDLSEIKRAAERAEELVAQLLAFSRRTPQATRAVDVNELVHRLEGMLRRLIPEDIRLTLRTDPSLRPVLVDPAQLEQALMNLVVNARDAIDARGEIEIETRHVDVEEAGSGLTPGPHALLVVSDTGRGMSRETIERAAEPFYTTKEPGKGTGLGLPTVYGIVESAGGQLRLDSEPGRGTAVRLLFPAAEHAGEQAAGRETRATILLAEDEPALRRLARSILDDLDYFVLEAADGAEALDLAERYRSTIDLLITDVVMPQLGGPELAKRLGLLRPDLKVLYVSGYADSQLVRSGLREGTVQMLHKPFSPDELAGKVNELLGTSGPPAARAGA